MPSVASALASLVLAATAPHALTAQMAHHIDAAVNEALIRQHVAAISLAIVENGQVVYAKGYGIRDVASGAKANAQTIYPIGSNSKQFTAAAIMLLQEQGRLSVHDSVAKYLPAAPHANELTIQNLLEQVSGLPDYTQTLEYTERFSQMVTPEQMLKTIQASPLAFRPGTNWQYSNTNYLLLSLIVAKASGEPYRAFVKQHLLTPLQLTSANFASNERTYPNEARGYTSFAMGSLHDPRREDYSWFQGAGDLMMSAEDLARWDIALDSGKVVSRASFAQMSTSKQLPNGVATGYGYGLGAGNRFLGHLIVGHLGGLAGFVSEDITFPDEHVAVVLLGNSDTFNPVPIAHDIIATIFGQPLPQATPKIVPETNAEDKQARLWLRRALSGDINAANSAPDFIASMMPTSAARASLLRDLRELGKRLGAAQTLHLISREGPPGVQAFDYYVTFARDTVEFQYAIVPSGKLDYLDFAPAYSY